MNVKEDIIQGASVTISKDGNACVRKFYVDGLGAFPPSYALLAATQSASIPIYGAGHPSIPGITVQTVTADALPGGVSAWVTVSYLPPASKNNPPQLGDKPRIEVGTSLVSAKTQKGYDVKTGKPVDLTLTPSSSLMLPAQTALVDVSIPLSTIRYTRRETIDPRAAAKAYVGTINKNKTGMYEAHYLLCSAITGASDDGGVTYVTTYEFQDNPETWDVDVSYIINGSPIGTPSTANGTLKRFSIYKDTDFNKLGLN